MLTETLQSHSHQGSRIAELQFKGGTNTCAHHVVAHRNGGENLPINGQGACQGLKNAQQTLFHHLHFRLSIPQFENC